ncbi:hypothetical protein VTL71DRAFT_4844 [Oculimacula yallundae]|uniref:BZIP domain-containing protein n=1 Tax=Oculimacula yallundae TaxID=86028 RepID=A0ABR4C349_9HELO
MMGAGERGETEPFVTLSSLSPSSLNGGAGNPSESPNTTPEESFDETTLLPGLLSATHDTRRAEYHMKDLDAFAKDLQNAANRAFPNEGRAQGRYSRVSVLLLRWEDDEMNVEWELDDLGKVFGKYGFETEKWLIPSKNSHLKLMSKVVDVVEEHDGDGGLVIVYYAGHASINASRGATWTCKQDPAYASLEWSAIQTLFEKADFDVLLLLDCCAAASAAPAVGSAVTETIAACGFESIAPQPGRYSFTNSLIEVLEDWIDSPPFSAAMLHNKVLSVLKHEQPERMQNGKRRKMECRRTPIHMVATADPTLPSIELGRRWPRKDLLPGGNSPAIASSSNSGPRKVGIPDEHQSSTPKGRAYLAESINTIQGDVYEIPRVIISLSLEKHQKLNSESCQKWLASCPTLIKFAKVEAVYNSFSALVLLSIPVFIWNLLPENAACSFVGYVTSPNFISAGSWPEQAKETAAPGPLDGLSSQAFHRKVEKKLACDHCKAARAACSGHLDGCQRCDDHGYRCKYAPTLQREGPAKDHINHLQRKLDQTEQALQLLREENASRSLREAPITLPSIDSFRNFDTEYRPEATTHEKSSIQKLDSSRPPNCYPETLPGEKSAQFPLLFHDPSQRRTQSPMSNVSEPGFDERPVSRVSVAEVQQNEFMRQQIAKRDAMLKDSHVYNGTPTPLPPPRRLVDIFDSNGTLSSLPPPHRLKDDESSWNDKKLAWIAPKSEYGELSKSPSLPGGKGMVKSESNSSHDSKDWYYPPDKKMKISSMTEPTQDDNTGKDRQTLYGSKGPREMLETRTPGPLYTNFSSHLRNATSSPALRSFNEFSPRPRSGVEPRPALMTPNMTPESTDATTRPSASSTQTPASTYQQEHHIYNYSTTPDRHVRESPPAAKSFRPPPVPSTASPPSAPVVEQDWTYITDIAERRRIQNRNAQRNYRKRLKRRLEDLEDRAGSSSSSRHPDSSTSAPQQYSPMGAGSQESSEVGSVVKDSQPLRYEADESHGRSIPRKERANLSLLNDMSV